MSPVLPILCVLLGASPAIETQFVQVAPARQERRWWSTPGQTRAVVLIHGLYVHPFSKTNVTRAHLHSWQKADCPLVKRLASEADVFAFSYAQTVSADEVAECPDLETQVRLLRREGYREIILIGHSAGGLIARQFIEDHPDCGVTKVIQVDAPNGGSGWTMWKTVRSNQIDFLDSLSKPTRRRMLAERADKHIPAQIEFACIVGTGTGVGDGLVSIRSQYTPELQRQGIPAYPFNSSHWTVVRSKKGIELLARLVREPQPRWEAWRVTAMRRYLLGD
ncbi:MAG TPA: alpha/beta fold hydrolase [Gemmataceae bacterium]|nr:alpha/beta fold hydrolase [Gemmataceae bacterium]